MFSWGHVNVYRHKYVFVNCIIGRIIINAKKKWIIFQHTNSLKTKSKGNYQAESTTFYLHKQIHKNKQLLCVKIASIHSTSSDVLSYSVGQTILFLLLVNSLLNCLSLWFVWKNRVFFSVLKSKSVKIKFFLKNLCKYIQLKFKFNITSQRKTISANEYRC